MNFFFKIKKFLKEVKSEAKKISWLKKEDLFKYTGLVIAVSLTVALILGLFDFLFFNILQKII